MLYLQRFFVWCILSINNEYLVCIKPRRYRVTECMPFSRLSHITIYRPCRNDSHILNMQLPRNKKKSLHERLEAGKPYLFVHILPHTAPVERNLVVIKMCELKMRRRYQPRFRLGDSEKASVTQSGRISDKQHDRTQRTKVSPSQNYPLHLSFEERPSSTCLHLEV